jgi:hypothetical protein
MGVDLSKQAIWWASTLASKQSDGWRLLTARCLLATGFCRHALWPCDCKTDSDCDAKGKLLRIQRDANVSYLSERQKQKVNMRACILGCQMHLGVVNVVARGAGRWWRWIRIVNPDPLVCRFYYLLFYFLAAGGWAFPLTVQSGCLFPIPNSSRILICFSKTKWYPFK